MYNYLESMTITVSPGVNNAEILNAMMAEGVCFRSSVIIPTTTFGGMLSGGCHVRKCSSIANFEVAMFLANIIFYF